jgi:hypothetical protein
MVALCLEHSVQYEALAENRIASMEREQNFLMDQIDEISGIRSTARFPPRARPVNISGGVMLNKVNVGPGAVVGVVNAGCNVGSIDVAITAMERHDPELAQAIARLTEAIGNSTEAPAPAKAEMLEIVNAVATEATQPKEQRRRFVIGPLLTRLAELATVAEGVRSAWERFGPLITAAFS